jgi:hypothetical protein
MTFPTSPINGATTTVNGISYTYNSSINSWKRSTTAIGDIQSNLGNATTNITTLFSNAASQATALNTIQANLGSFETYANTKIGTNTNGNLVVVATTSSTDATTGALVVRGGAGIGGDMYIAGNIVPAANVTYDLGSSTTWFRDLWLSAGTIHIGGAKITQDSASGAIAIVPKATANNPNPVATVFSATGAITTANTAGGTISAANIAAATASNDFNVVGNLTANTATIAGNIFANKFYTTNGLYWAGNGVAFSSGASFTASSTAPATPAAGEQWYDTVNDILYEFIGNYWVDIQSATVSIGDYNNVVVDNISANANITTANIYADRFFYSNGTAFSSSSFGNTDVGIYLTANPITSIRSSSSLVSFASAGGNAQVQIGGVQVATISQSQFNITGNVIATSNVSATHFVFANGVSIIAGINTTNANIGAFQTYANANIGTLYSGNVITNANLGAFQTYANTAFNYGNTQVASYLTSNVSGVAARTDAMNIPAGSTAQRPTTTANGAIRYNTTLNRLESYMPSAGWLSIVSDSYTVSYMLVAGGGCGGVWHAGGGGGGGVITGTSGALIPGSDSIVFTIGAGGTTTDTTVRGINGANTSATISGTSYIAQGGGAGGNYDTSPPLPGGSGGGGNGDGNVARYTGAAGVPGQGYAGGNGYAPAGHTGGGGGGAGGVGGTPTDNITAGSGGPGYTWLNGETYAGGGGGGTWYGGNSYNAGAGGAGGGGRGSYADNSAVATYGPRPGTANTGGGGGGSGAQGGGGGNRAAYVTGGSGVVILRYLGSQRGTGGTVTTSGGYTYHTFTGSGTFSA